MERRKRTTLRLRTFILALFGFILQLPIIYTQPSFLPFRFVSEPSDTVVRLGRPATLECSVDTRNPSFEWIKDGVPLRRTSAYSVGSDGSLRISSVTDATTGSYRCQVRVYYDSSNSYSISSRQAEVSMATLRLEPTHPIDVTEVYEGDTARFECKVEGSGPFTYEWMRNSQQLDLSEERITARYKLLPSGTLEILGLRVSDEGEYRCRVRSAHGLQGLSRQAQLTLDRGPPIGSREFVFTQRLEGDMEFKVGTPVVLEVATTQPATFRWYKDEEEILLSGTHYSYIGQGSLYIQELEEIDTGLYKVVATSVADGSVIESSAKLVALVPPSYIQPPSNKYGNEGSVVILPCTTYGIPSPTVVWMMDGDPITIGRDFQLVQGQSLSISSALMSDTGFYQCVASNEVGNVQSSMQLIILGQGVPLPEVPTPSPPTQRSTTTPRPTTLFREPILPTFPIDPPTGTLVPSAPRRVSVSKTSSRSTFLNWQPPATTNGEIKKYRILLQAEGSDIRPRIIFHSGDTAKIIRDLLPDTLYTVQITAINDNGPGEISDPISFRTGEAVEVPEEPQNLDAMVQSSTSVLVTWEAPIDTFGELEGYRLYYAEQNGLASREIEIPVLGTSYLVQNLDPFTHYGFRVLAINANGAGESTDVRHVQTFSAKPDSPPANFTSQSTSTSSITLYWDPPAADQNGVITEYRIKYRLKDNAESKAEIKVIGSFNSYTVSDLDSDTAYEFKIAAVTVNGTGPYTDGWLQEATPDRDIGESKPPGPPTNLQIEGSPDRILVQWSPPSDPLVRVRGYMLDYGKGIVGQNFRNLGPDVLRFVIRDVEENALYVIRLRAFNQAGEGKNVYETVFTRRVTEMTPLMVPFPVKALTQSANSIKLQWTDPNPSRDGTVYIISYDLDDMSMMYKQVNTSRTYYVFEDLEPFSTYVFLVRISQGESRMSDLSMEARNRTFEAVPASAPNGLIVRGSDNSSSLYLRWNGPARPNGIMTGYIIYYTSEDKTTSIADWEKVELTGNKTTAVLTDLDGETIYHVRVQGVNGAGLSPVSDIASGTTGVADLPPIGGGAGGPDTGLSGAAVAGFPWWLWLIGLALLALILLLLLLLLCCALCGCFKCCASLCPCCGDICGAGGCFGQCFQGLARCWVGCCPCCCSDEEECVAFCSKLCCGACICGAAGGRAAGGKNGAATAISAGSYKSNGPDVLMSSTVEETDTLIQANGEAQTDFGGSRKVEAMQPFETMTRFSHPSRVPYVHPANGGTTIRRQGSVYETDNGRIQFNEQHWMTDRRQHYLPTAEPIIKKSTGYFEGDRGFVREHHSGSGEGMGQSITYNTTNVHVSGEHEESHSEAGRRGAITPVTSVSTQMVGYTPSIEAGLDPFTITFEETTTTHSIEKSVPLLDGTNYKTVSNHETHSKSYSTSDASKDRNLQEMLQNGLDHGPLAIDVPSTRMEPLTAITAPVYSRSTLDRGGNTSSLDSYSSSSHNHISSDTNLQAASKATSNLHTYESEAMSNTHNQASDFNLQSSRATTNLNSYHSDLTDTGLGYHVELPATLPRHGSDFHTSFEEHSESRMRNYGLNSGQGRVDYASSHMAATDGQVIRSEETKESFPYTASDMFGGDLGASSHHDMGPSSLPNMGYLPIDDRAAHHDYQSSSHQTSGYQSSRRMEMSSSDHLNGMDSLRSRGSHMSDNHFGNHDMDVLNSGSAFRYKSNASLDGNLASSRGRVDNYHTIDRSEHIDRLENLRRLTNKVLSASSSRLPTQNGSGLHSFSTDHLDTGGHSDGYESNFSQRQVYRARSGSSGYQSTGNLVGGSGGQYSFNNNNSKAIMIEDEPSSSEDSGSGRKPRQSLPYSQSRDGLVRVSPSPNAHHYLPPPPDHYGRGPLERSQSIADHIGKDQGRRSRPSDQSNPPLSGEGSETHRRLMRSFSLDRLNPQRGDPRISPPPPVYQYHSSGSSENPRYIYSSGYHSDTTLSSGGHEEHSGHGGPSRAGQNPNLSSFTVPGPPPHYQTGPSRVRISAPTYSPLKRTNQPSATLKVRAQPLGSPQDGRISPESATRTFSTEDLNAEMQHLEGLMKDLNAITASEYECN